MFIYMEIQKVFSNIEDPEETLYSVLMSENELALFSEVKEKVEESNNNTLGTAGKVALGAGLTTALAGGVAENQMVNNIAKKTASKYGVKKIGYGFNSGFRAPTNEALNKALDVSGRTLTQSKGFKIARRADKIGTGVALAGAGLMAVNHFLNKNKNQ